MLAALRNIRLVNTYNYNQTQNRVTCLSCQYTLFCFFPATNRSNSTPDIFTFLEKGMITRAIVTPIKANCVFDITMYCRLSRMAEPTDKIAEIHQMILKQSEVFFISFNVTPLL